MINEKEIICDKINLLKNNKEVIFKEYNEVDIDKFNKIILDNLVTINDKILLNKDGVKTYVILCDLIYDKVITSKLIMFQKINKEAKIIENEFIKEKKKIYNLKIYE